MTDCPPGWSIAPLHEICTINPRIDRNSIDGETVVSFVPMSAVEAGTGNIDVRETRAFETVRKGYTPFRKDDVLFAKITPCMENGKMAVVPELVSEYGFGSTEFHVLRPAGGVDPHFLYHAVSNREFRFHAQHNMAGAVGQKRVPATIVEEHEVGLPPTNEQHRIVERIETHFNEIDRGVESLHDAKRAIGLYRQSLLKSAFEGRLTADWRAEHPGELDCQDGLLAKIREERYTAAIDDWRGAVTEWRKGDRAGKEPKRPKPPIEMRAKHIPRNAMPACVAPWAFARLGELHVRVSDGPFGSNLKTRDYTDAGIRVIRLENVGHGEFLEDKRSFVSREKFETIKKHSVFPGTIIVSSFITKHVRVCVVPESIPIAINKADCLAVKVQGERTSAAFLAYFLQSKQVFRQLEALVHGVGRPRINTTQLRELHVPVCTPAEQAEIVRMLDARLESAQALDEEIDANLTRAEALRQSILKQAFSGKLIPQDPNDEPAQALLARIRAARDKEAPSKPQKPKRQRRTANP